MQTVPGRLATALILVGLIVGALLALATWTRRRTRPTLASPRGLMTVLAIAPLLGLVAYSALPRTSFLLARNMSILVPYGTIAAGVVLVGLRWRTARIATASLVLIGLLIGGVVLQRPSNHKPDTRAAARYIDARVPAGAVLINGAFYLSPNGPPAKAVLTYLHRPYVYAPGKAADRSTSIYFPGTRITEGYATAARERRPVVLMAPGGERILNFLNLPAKYQPGFRLGGQQLTPGLAGGYGVRYWLPM